MFYDLMPSVISFQSVIKSGGNVRGDAKQIGRYFK